MNVPGNMAASVRGRPIRSVRVRDKRCRNDSGEENVPLDLTREPSDNMREILQNVAKLHGVSNMRKLGHLNNFIKLLCSTGYCVKTLGFTYEEIIICLRLALLNEAKEVRAAGLRALRYLLRDVSVLQRILRLQVDYLISRCIDIKQSNEVERTQALRLVRKMITVNALLFPSSVTNSLIAIGNDGLQERDPMVRACIAIVCELALKNPAVVAQRGGLCTILKSVIDCQLSRINEALITTILHLLNHPHTRQYVRADVELEQILAPYTDFHYRHNPETTEAQLKEDRQARFLASKMAIVAAFRSWSGIINLCKSGHSGIQSLIGVLCIRNMEVRKGLLEVLYEIFRLPVPIVTNEFEEALHSIDPSRFQDSWRLSDGFVAAESKVVLPHRARSRPDLMDNYLALVLSAFITSGVLEGLVEVITSSDDQTSVRATILLGELLHMANTILPHTHSHHLHCLPTLINMAASFDLPQEKRLRASAAVNHLKRFHEKKKRGPRPHSLYLDQIVRKAISSPHRREQPPRTHKDIYAIKDTEEALMMNLRDSHILNHKQNLEWNWVLISTILKWPNANLRQSKDEQMHKFVRRLLYFYKPSSKLYAALELDHSKGRPLTVVGCQFVEFLMDSEEDGQGYLEELVRDVVAWLPTTSGAKPERSLQSNGLLNTLSQHYFLFLGTLSAQPHGVKVLEKCSVFQCLLNMCSMKNQDALLKLTVASLDYSREGLARVILSKILTAATDACRLYATKHLRVLLRANVEFFSNWGMELLVTQLHDHNKAISLEALDILDEACEDKANLHTLIQMKPALSHLGDKGVLLLLRFLSIPKGFSYLNERGYVTKQLEKWQKEYNLKYVDLIEEQLNEALTTYRKPVDGDNYVRRSNQRLQRPNVYLPVHLYGQLVYDKTGCHLLEAQNVVPDLSYTVRSPVLDKWEGIKQLKAALWALGNIGSSNWGLNLLQEEAVIPDIIALAQHCEVLSIRGTCVYVLGLISKTKQGCDVLRQQGWDSVRHSRRQLWPVAPDEVEQAGPLAATELSSVPSTLSLNSESTSSRHNSESESQPSLFYIEDDSLTFSDDHHHPHHHHSSSSSRPHKSHKERSSTGGSSRFLLSTSRLVPRGFLNSLSLAAGKKPRSISDPKSLSARQHDDHHHHHHRSGGGGGGGGGGGRRVRTVTEPASLCYSPSSSSEVFYNGGSGNHHHHQPSQPPRSPTISLETSFLGNRIAGTLTTTTTAASQPGGGGDGGGGDDKAGSSSSVCEIEVCLPKSTGAGPGPGAEEAAAAAAAAAAGAGGGGVRESSTGGGGAGAQRERLASGDGPSCLTSSTAAGGGGGAPTFKSRSQSFNTDTTTSGISSMSSSPSRETAGPTTPGTAATTPGTAASASTGASTGASTPTTPGSSTTTTNNTTTTTITTTDSSSSVNANDLDCASLDTVGSAQTVKTAGSSTPPPPSSATSASSQQPPLTPSPSSATSPQSNHTPLSKASSVLLVPPGSAHTLPRRAQSLKSPSAQAMKGLADYGFIYTSPRDALGYATLKRLQQQRIHPSLSHSEALASPAKDVLFTDTITMKTGSLDSRLTSRRYDMYYKRYSCSGPVQMACQRKVSRAPLPRYSPRHQRKFSQALLPRYSPRFPNKKRHSCSGYLPTVGGTRRLSDSLIPRFLKALSFASLDKEDLLSPINHATLQRSSSVRSMVSSATYGCSDDYVGLALPVDINDMFQIKESSYFQKRTSPTSGEKKFFGESDGFVSGPPLKTQFSISELLDKSRPEQKGQGEGEEVHQEETGLQEHCEENCLYCVGLAVVGRSGTGTGTGNHLNSTHNRNDVSDNQFPTWCGPSSSHNHLEVVPQSKYSGVSGCSDAVSGESVNTPTPTPNIVLGVRPGCEDSPLSRVLLRKEVLRLVVNLSSSVGTKGHETGLLTIKEKFPYAFDDICLYSEVSYLLAHCMFRLPSRRFIQELFQDVQFSLMYDEADTILSMAPKKEEDFVAAP